ncbi:hypothetical protein IIC65_04645 [Candidatus Sumerlaeota bacterium]|nr:hypothetical protein [Candidatus Sumerlaeota bacterium]
MKLTLKTRAALTVAAVALMMSAGLLYAQQGPKTVTISGTLVDLSCAAKGMVMMGSDFNAKNDTHKTPNGEMASCATMCLRGGQPAAIFSDGKIQAVLLANASLNLYKFAVKEVDIEGFYAGSDKDAVKTFMPARIRLKGTEDWTAVQAAEMH